MMNDVKSLSQTTYHLHLLISDCLLHYIRVLITVYGYNEVDNQTSIHDVTIHVVMNKTLNELFIYIRGKIQKLELYNVL